MIFFPLLADPVWSSAIVLVGTALIAGGANWLALGEWRRAAARHWTERARALAQARAAIGLNSALIVMAGLLFGGQNSDDFPWWDLIAAFVGIVAGSYPLQRAVYPARTVRAWLTALLINFSLNALSLGLFVACFLAMPNDFGPKAWLVAGAWIAVQFALAFGGWLRLLRWLRLLVPPSTRLVRIVADASTRTGVPVRDVWESPSPASQALVLVTTRTLIFTRSLVERLSDAELEAVCLHELAHLTEPKPVTRLRVLSAFSRAPVLFAPPLVMLIGKSATLIILLIVVIGVPVALVGMKRRMEQRADRMAAAATGNPVVYTRALEKIHEANQIPAVMGGWGKRVHPDLYDRLLAVGVTPDYPRPAKPKRFHWISGVLAILLVLSLVQVIFSD